MFIIRILRVWYKSSHHIKGLYYDLLLHILQII